MNKTRKIIISGGGTGGHIFPAISIANELKKRLEDSEIMFVGALDRMEMERVPQAGYKIIGLPIMGLYRKHLYKNIKVIWKLLLSMRRAKQIIRDFKPEIAIGVGGYASGPLLRVASSMQIPTLIQEQNSYAGKTNKWLSKRAQKICVAYDGMERFFPKDKIAITGNPIRQNLLNISISPEEARTTFNLDPSKKTVLILGGSLGARSLNNAVIKHLKELSSSQIQFIWQTGKLYIANAQAACSEVTSDNLYVSDFISNMDVAYQAADLVISRAGAGTISELCVLGKPAILIPSPNVSEDHQTQNALALVKINAALMIKDQDALETMISTALETIQNEELLLTLTKNIATLAHKNASERIVDEIIQIIDKNRQHSEK